MKNAGWKSRLRHYTNLSKTATRLRKLVGLGRFSSFRGSGLENEAREDLALVEFASKS
jgi:hypothetical protein